MGAHRDAISIGDIMVKAYGLPGRMVSGVCGLLLCIGVLVAQVGAMAMCLRLF